jgi:ketosteroid isomerase-like protein
MSQDNAKLVQQAYQHFKQGNIPAVLELMAENVEWHTPEIENISFSGTRVGRAKVGEFFSLLAQHQDALQFEPQQFVAQDDKVVALGQYEWKIKKTGRTYKSPFAHVFTIREGRVTGFHEYLDTARAAAAYK